MSEGGQKGVRRESEGVRKGGQKKVVRKGVGKGLERG